MDISTTKPRKTRSPINALKILNEMRKQHGVAAVRKVLPRSSTKPVKVTREVIRQIALEVWKKYPQALNSNEYELGELTLGLVEKEIGQRIADLKKGQK
jgi:hypothetical protein